MQNAYNFAEKAHRGQSRKYTGEPYITHCLEVAGLVALAGLKPIAVKAAVLHDTIGDTEATYPEVHREFGPVVADMVWALTEPTKKPNVTRAQRLAEYNLELLEGGYEVRSIKCADIISNCRRIVRLDRKFAATYLLEKRTTLNMFGLSEVNSMLFEEANRIVDVGILELQNA